MVRRFISLFLLFNSLAFAGLQYLSKSIETQTAFEMVTTDFVEDIHSSGSAYDDGIDKDVPLGFTFRFNGIDYTEVDIDSNGYLVFGDDPKSVYTNQSLPQNDKPQSIYPYWDDLNMAKGGTIRYDTLGSGDDIHFVVSWEDIPQYPSNGAYSLQVVLYKNGSIRFRYDSTSDVDGNSGTIGVQEDISHYDQHTFNDSNSFDATKDILYTLPMAKMSLSKTSCVLSDPINGISNPKRVPNATIRYAIEVKNEGGATANDVKVDDTLTDDFDSSTIENLQIQSGVCDCLGVSSASNNGANGTANGVNPVVLDFGDVGAGTVANPTTECGYFEVKLI